MNIRALLPSIPDSAWAWAAFYFVLSAAAWAYFLGLGFSSSWTQWGLALAIGTLFVLFGVSVWALLGFLPGLKNPAWLSRHQAISLSLACFVLHSGLAGGLTALGVWPFPRLWFLGALPFAWQ